MEFGDVFYGPKTKMEMILAHLETLPKGARQVRITDFEYLMTDQIRQERDEGKNWNDIWVIPFYNGVMFSGYSLCLGATDQNRKMKNKRNTFIRLRKNRAGYLYCLLTPPGSTKQKNVYIGKLVVESCLHHTIAPGYSTQHFDCCRDNDSIENLGIADYKTQAHTRAPYNLPGQKIAILKEKDGVVVRYSSSCDVDGIPMNTIHTRVQNRLVIDGWTWRYDTLTLIDDEEFKQYKNYTSYVSNMGRVAKRVYEKEFVEMQLSTKRGYIMIKGKYLHRIVWELFVGPIEDGFVVDHGDNNVHNNRLDNLKSMTMAENSRHAIGNLYKLINKITYEEHTVPTLSNAAKIVGCCQKTIGNVVNGKLGKDDGMYGCWYIECIGAVNPVQRDAIKRRRIIAN
jgi:hypothetical protein